MDTEADLQFRPRTGKAASTPLLPEVEAYLQLLVVIFLMNSKRYKEVSRTSEPEEQAPSGAWGLREKPSLVKNWRESLGSSSSPSTLSPMWECAEPHIQGSPLRPY